MLGAVFGLAVLLSALLGETVHASDLSRPVVVELFTSQGCSSCPPADALLGELAARPELLAVAEHVDYWDYLGWKDPLASREHSLRQRAYARRLGLSYVYTPQMVIEGTTQAAGSDRSAVLRLISDARPISLVSVRIARDPDGRLMVHLDAASLTEPADVWLLWIEPHRMTAIAAGENRGKQGITYNAVREVARLAVWSGEPTSLPIADDFQAAGLRATVLVQEADIGRIIGAARTEGPPWISPSGEP